MTQTEKRISLIEALVAEDARLSGTEIPASPEAQKRLLRALMNIRRPKPVDAHILRIQDAYLQDELSAAGITALSSLTPITDDLYLRQGDITTLQCGAIVNAANSGMTGCYVPNHACIDNCIHTFAGMQLRQTCAELMAQQGHDEPVGQAKITPGYNLPCDYILHTVGPCIDRALRPEDEHQLAACYRACLELADAHAIDSIAFCCISTGVFSFPHRRAAEIAVETVCAYKRKTGSPIKVIFNVFRDDDHAHYRDILTAHRAAQAGT